MSFFDTAIQNAKDFLSGAPKHGTTDSIYSSPALKDLVSFAANGKKTEKGGILPWEYLGENWHKVFPYSFYVTVESGGKVGKAGKLTKSGSKIDLKYTYTLPIPPQSIAIDMVSASKVDATLGGVVEETSNNVFWTISLSGTTGTAVSRAVSNDNTANSRRKPADQFRERLATTGLLAGIAAGINGVLTKAGNVADSVAASASAFASGNIAGGASGVTGALNDLLLPPQLFNSSAVNGKVNGFTEIHELHRFLYTYSFLKGKDPSRYNLWFCNYKDGQKWRVIVQKFTLTKSAQSPMLYRYNIQLKAWNVRAADADDKKGEVTAQDRYAPGGDLASVNTVGLPGLVKGFRGLAGNLHAFKR